MTPKPSRCLRRTLGAVGLIVIFLSLPFTGHEVNIKSGGDKAPDLLNSILGTTHGIFAIAWGWVLIFGAYSKNVCYLHLAFWGSFLLCGYSAFILTGLILPYVNNSPPSKVPSTQFADPSAPVPAPTPVTVPPKATTRRAPTQTHKQVTEMMVILSGLLPVGSAFFIWKYRTQIEATLLPAH